MAAMWLLNVRHTVCLFYPRSPLRIRHRLITTEQSSGRNLVIHQRRHRRDAIDTVRCGAALQAAVARAHAVLPWRLAGVAHARQERTGAGCRRLCCCRCCSGGRCGRIAAAVQILSRMVDRLSRHADRFAIADDVAAAGAGREIGGQRNRVQIDAGSIVGHGGAAAAVFQWRRTEATALLGAVVVCVVGVDVVDVDCVVRICWVSVVWFGFGDHWANIVVNRCRAIQS